MKILDYFIEEKLDEYAIYRLSHEKWSAFLNDITTDFRRCYISDEDLEEKKGVFSNKSTIEILNNILPDKASVLSGNFGEMLSYFSVCQKYQEDSIKILAPKKWLWSIDRNKPMQYTDVIIFLVDINGDLEKDTLITLESKMLTERKKNYNPINLAIEGAKKDSNTRLSQTLIWLSEIYTKQNNPNDLQIIERFQYPIENNSFKRIIKAAAIIDTKIEKRILLEDIEEHNGISLIIFSIHDLKEAYQKSKQLIFDSVK